MVERRMEVKVKEIIPREVQETVEEPQPTIAKRRGLSGLKKAALVGLAVIAGRASIGFPGSNPSTDSNPSNPQVSIGNTSNNPENPGAPVSGEALKAEIEQKYNINILTMKEAFDMMHMNYDDQNPVEVGQSPPVRWTDKQLNLLGTMLSFEPTSLYEPKDGKKLGIFLGDFGTNCPCEGISYGSTGIIGLKVEGLDPNNQGNSFSLLTHELTHRFDASTKEKLWGEVNAILGDKSYLALKDFDFQTTKDLNYDQIQGLKLENINDNDKVRALLTLKSFAPDQSFVEGIAGVSQRYVTGYDRFMRAIGPLLDGNGYTSEALTEALPGLAPSASPDSSPDPSAATESATPVPEDKLAVLYPKTKELYDLYKNEVFDGKEYDDALLLKIQYSPEQLAKMQQSDLRDEQKAHHRFQDNRVIAQVEQVPEVKEELEALENKYGVKFLSETSISPDDAQTIAKILSLFPKNLYPQGEDNMLSIVLLSDYSGKVPSGNYTILYTNNLHSEGDFHVGDKLLDAVPSLAGDLLAIKDTRNANQAQKEMTNILGGEKFINRPGSLYPVLDDLSMLHDPVEADLIAGFNMNTGRRPSPAAIFNTLAHEYVGGWQSFSRFAEIVNPNISRADLLKMNTQTSNTKIAELYRLFKGIYGVEFTGKVNSQGIPQVK